MSFLSEVISTKGETDTEELNIKIPEHNTNTNQLKVKLLEYIKDVFCNRIFVTSRQSKLNGFIKESEVIISRQEKLSDTLKQLLKTDHIKKTHDIKELTKKLEESQAILDEIAVFLEMMGEVLSLQQLIHTKNYEKCISIIKYLENLQNWCEYDNLINHVKNIISTSKVKLRFNIKKEINNDLIQDISTNDVKCHSIFIGNYDTLSNLFKNTYYLDGEDSSILIELSLFIWNNILSPFVVKTVSKIESEKNSIKIYMNKNANSVVENFDMLKLTLNFMENFRKLALNDVKNVFTFICDFILRRTELLWEYCKKENCDINILDYLKSYFKSQFEENYKERLNDLELLLTKNIISPKFLPKIIGEELLHKANLILLKSKTMSCKNKLKVAEYIVEYLNLIEKVIIEHFIDNVSKLNEEEARNLFNYVKVVLKLYYVNYIDKEKYKSDEKINSFDINCKFISDTLKLWENKYSGAIVSRTQIGKPVFLMMPL